MRLTAPTYRQQGATRAGSAPGALKEGSSPSIENGRLRHPRSLRRRECRAEIGGWAGFSAGPSRAPYHLSREETVDEPLALLGGKLKTAVSGFPVSRSGPSSPPRGRFPGRCYQGFFYYWPLRTPQRELVECMDGEGPRQCLCPPLFSLFTA